jgi:2-dehydropantoate 2-reductase
MKICVIGCGAVGSLFAAHLAKAGEAEVWAYDVWKEHIGATGKKWLRLSGSVALTDQLYANRDARELRD